jgi:hypothetical protein
LYAASEKLRNLIPSFFERFGKIYERDQYASADIIVGEGQIVLPLMRSVPTNSSIVRGTP